MSKKLSEFLFSFGVMVAGLALLFFGSVSVTSSKVTRLMAQLPLASARAESVDDAMTPAVLPVSRPALPLPKDDAPFPGDLTAKAALAVDDKTNTVLFKKNIKETRPLASITKLMSALVLLDLPINWASTTVITEEDADPSSHHLNVGEEYTLEDLWRVALIGSSNSAISALVRASGLPEENFVALMNRKATELSLPSLHFVEPTGLDSRNAGNAVDVSRLLAAALKMDKIYRALSTGQYSLQPLNKNQPRQVWSTDRLLTNWIPNTFNKKEMAGKTGFIEDAGYNFTVRLTDDSGQALRVVILGAAGSDQRFTEARDLAEWVLGHYAWPGETGYEALTAPAR